MSRMRFGHHLPKHYFVTAVPLCLTLVFNPEVGQAETTVHGSLSIGFEHDTNVAVDELDRSSNLSDVGRLYDGNLRISHDFNDSVSGKVSYDFSAIDYAEFDRLSRQTQSLGAGLSADLGGVKAGLNYFFTNTRLDNNNFLTYHRLSPSISGFASKRWFFRGAWVYGDKTLERRPGRDAVTHGLETDAYYFWRGLRRYFNIGYAFRHENSRADRFDFEGHLIKLRAVQRFDIGASLSTLEAGIRYEERDYQSVTPSIGEPRYDDRLKISISFDYQMTKQINWRFYANYSDYQSNLPSADYDQTVVGSALEFSF